jgi:hypothetical protein
MIVFVLCGKTVTAENNRTLKEFWQELYVIKNFNEKIGGEILFNNLHSIGLGSYDWFLEGKIDYHAKSWLDMELMYRHEFYDMNGTTVQEYRPMFRLSGKKRLGNISIRNRHKIECRMFEVGENHIRYRSDLRVKPCWNLTSLNVNPYLTEEIFIARGRMTRNRLYGGISGQKGRFEPGLYFLLQSDAFESGWKFRNILGIILGIEI